VLSVRPSSLIQERSKNDFPLPAGAHSTVTRAASLSWSNRPGRDTTPAAPG